MSWWKRLLQRVRGDGTGKPGAGPGCNHGEIHLREGTADFEWFIARGELEMAGDLRHGAIHLANLLSYDPGRQEWIELLEGYLQAAGSDPESLIPRGEKAYYSTEAMRAYIWNRQGRLADAVKHLSDVTYAKQDSSYLEAWGLNWLEAPGALEGLPIETGLFVFSLALNRHPDARLSTVTQLRNVRRWARLAERFATLHPTDGALRDGMFGMLRAGLLRKAGLYDEAEALVRSQLSASPSWPLATALGLILRQKGATAEAEQAFEQALALDPSDVSARLEAGDMFWERGKWDRALHWYENSLTKQKDHPWAQPSAAYCRWMLTEDEGHLRELTALAKGGNDRAGFLYNRLYSVGLPEPVDATANMLRQFREQILQKGDQAPEGDAELDLTLSGLEAPSNFLAFRLEMAALKQPLSLAVKVERVPTPDPRQRITPVRWPLWRYEGTDASPALPPPPETVLNRIRDLALEPYDGRANWAAASLVAEELGASQAEAILATMVHPPAVPEGTHALAWLPRVQLAAAQVLAHLDGGWEGSVRREALLSVLLGPQDWATEAAIRALAQLGAEYEPVAPHIGDAFQQLADARPDSGFCCWEYTLYSCWLDLPHLFPKEREEIQRKLKALEADLE